MGTLKDWIFYGPVTGYAYDLLQKVSGYDKALANFVKSFDVPSDSQILDAGCGNGVTSLALASQLGREGQVIGFDLSRTAIRKANSKRDWTYQHNAQFFIGDVNQINPLYNLEGLIGQNVKIIRTIEEGSFDWVFASGVLEYARDINQGVKELSRYLRPGGTLVTIPMRDNVIGKTLRRFMGFKIHSADEIIGAFMKSGFLEPKEVPIENRMLRTCRFSIVGESSPYRVPKATRNSVIRKTK